MHSQDSAQISNRASPDEIAHLTELERCVVWLSTWTIHHANHVRPNRDGLKVGGHQASSASLATIMTTLYFRFLRPEDRVAVKPHAAPALHAIHYLMGRQAREQLERFRSLGGMQSYPSRTKDKIAIDFSTGSVGLGVAITPFASLAQDYVQARAWGAGQKSGRMIALVGDAELDEGSVFESMLEGWKHDVRNIWWVVDYNRQSLDGVMQDRLFGRFDAIFQATGWDVVTLKYGKKLEAAFQGPDGAALRDWIDGCSNSRYSAFTFKGGAAWRAALEKDLGRLPGVRAILDGNDDASLADLMTNLGGHDPETLLEAFRAIDHDRPVVFFAYTVKGRGLPFAGHKDNHAGLMNLEQVGAFREKMGIVAGGEWEPLAAARADHERLSRFITDAPFLANDPRPDAAAIAVPDALPAPQEAKLSTQEGFGRILAEIAREDSVLAQRIVTMSPDVTVSTNLGGWVNRRGIFDRVIRPDVFRDEQIPSAQRWEMSPHGQHIELGIAENNLFLALSAFGLSASLFGERLLPIGTLYDPFIARGLDALKYACYQDARFLLVGTPSGLTLAPEGGAHQSFETPLIGMAQPGLSYFEPAYVDELAEIMRWAFVHMQERAGGSVYLRLSTRGQVQPERELSPKTRADIIEGAYWIVPPENGSDLALVYCGAVASEARAAFDMLREDAPGAGLLAVTSPDRLHANWRKALKDGQGARSHIEKLLSPLRQGAALVSVIDGHPAALSWLGGVGAYRIEALGVDRFGQSGDLIDLYRAYGLDADAILDACARALMR